MEWEELAANGRRDVWPLRATARGGDKPAFNPYKRTRIARAAPRVK